MSISCLINANIHRVKEGARVLEDVARFVLRDDDLFQKVRQLRHRLQTTPPSYSSQPDLGGSTLKENNVRHNLIQVVLANSSRMQEALRVLEEITTDDIQKPKMKMLRYQAYDLQQLFYKKLNVFLQQDKLIGLYPIIDVDIINRSIEEVTEILNQSSIKLVQFRSKQPCKQTFLKNALKFKQLLAFDKLFIINDHIDVALDIADGIHLGQKDYPLERVKKILPDNFILGVSCHNIAEAKLAEKIGASYLSVGCLFPTRSKPDTIRTPLTELEQIQQNTHLPICAIGGINLSNLQTILSYKVSMIAVISSIWQQLDPCLAIRTMQEQMLGKVSLRNGS